MAYTPTTWVNNVTQINETNMNHIEGGIDDVTMDLGTHEGVKATTSTIGHVMVDNSTILVDGNGVISASSSGTSDKGYNADLEYMYNTNVKPIALFQSDETYTSGAGTQSADTTNVKIGSQSLKILENDNTAGNLSSSRTVTVDLTKFQDGSASATSDYIVVCFYISDVTKINTAGIGIDIQFYNAGSTKYFEYSIATGLVTGWNVVKIAKSAFAVGSGMTWDIIASVSLYWASLANAQNAYVSFQYIALVRKDPSSAKPNPFQRLVNGTYTREFAINSGEWVIVNEFGKIVAKNLNAESNTNETSAGMLVGTKGYTDGFRIHLRTQFIATAFNAIGWDVDAINRIHCWEQGGIIYFYSRKNASVEVTASFTHGAVAGDTVDLYLHKNGSTITLQLVKNNDMANMIERVLTTTVSGTGYISIYQYTGAIKNSFSALSITTLEHANHASVAEVAKSVVNQGYEKVLGNVLLASSVAQIDINLPSGYKYYRIQGYAKSSTSTGRDISIRLNDMSGNSYYTVESLQSGTTTAVTTSGALTSGTLKGAIASNTGDYSNLIIDIENMGTTNKLINYRYGGTSAGSLSMVNSSVVVLSLSGAITKISLIASADAFAAGTNLQILGVK